MEGYREPKALDRERIVAGLSEGRRIGGEIVVLSETESTNDEVRRRAEAETVEEGLVVFAEHQTAGRGRNGARWQSPPMRNLLFSVLLRPQGTPASWTWLTHGAAVALCRAIEEVCAIEAWVKWPNDVYVQGARKVAGILVETRGEDAVVGMGVNVREDGLPAPEGLAAEAASLEGVSGQGIDRDRLAIAVLRHLDEVYRCGETVDGGVGKMIGEAGERSLLAGKRISLRVNGVLETGKCLGLGAKGELRVLADRDRGGGELLLLTQAEEVRLTEKG